MVLGLKTLKKKLVEDHRKTMEQIEKDNELAEEKRQKRELERIKEKKKQAIKETKEKELQLKKEKRENEERKLKNVFWLELQFRTESNIDICKRMKYSEVLKVYNQIKEQLTSDSKIIEFETKDGPQCLIKSKYSPCKLRVYVW